MWWFLTREVLRLRGQINRQAPWDVMVDLFFYRDPEEVIERDKKKTRSDLICFVCLLWNFQTEKEDQTGFGGQNRDGKQLALDSQYIDDGPSMMPSSENYAGNRDNWGASADNWGTSAGGADANEWSATTGTGNTATSAW